MRVRGDSSLLHHCKALSLLFVLNYQFFVWFHYSQVTVMDKDVCFMTADLTTCKISIFPIDYFTAFWSKITCTKRSMQKLNVDTVLINHS